MSFLEILGLIATITGIISFLKNDAKDLFSFFKKVFHDLMTGQMNSLNSFKKVLISVAKYLFAPYKKNPILNLS